MSERTQTGQNPILRTKLHRPVLPGDFLCRPRLHDLMNLGLDLPLTLVSAPAGYGKSLLVGHWIASLDVPCAWLSLDRSDCAADLFVDYLLAAVEMIDPNACPQTRRMARAAESPTTQSLAGSLANELDALASPLVLVLDDYHLIDGSSEVHALLRQLLAHPPRPLHLVIVTRRDPPLRMTELRANGRLTEVRLADLRFTAEETRTLLRTVLEFAIGDRALANLQREMEGWAVGLRLVSLALRGEEDRDGFLQNLQGGIAHTRNYLLQEVIACQPLELRNRLLRTSILGRFCAGLCDAVGAIDVRPGSSGSGGEVFLQTVQDRNLFTIALDDQGEWFRYHHLFRDLLRVELRKTLGPAAITVLHRRASDWFEQHALIGEAIHHALQARDATGAAEILERHRRVEQDQDRWRNIERWLAVLPAETKEQRPGLLLSQAWVLHDRYQLRGIAPIVERLESLVEQDALDSVSLGELRFFEGVLQFWAGNGDLSKKLCEEAQARIPETHPRIAGLVEIYLALANYLIGQGDAALQSLNERIQDRSFLADAFLSRMILARSFLHTFSGRLPLAIQDAGSVARIARQGGMAYMEGWGRYLEGASCFRANELEPALSCFSPSFEHRYSMHTRAAIDALVALALTYQALRQPDAATETMERLLAFAGELQDSQHLSVARSGQARLALARGEIQAAIAWLRAFDGQPSGPAMFVWLEVSSVTQARVLLAIGSEESLQQANDLLAKLHDVAEVQHNTCQTIELLALRALALDKLGRAEEALSALERAVGLAEPGGWARPFVEPGPAMAALLRRLGEGLKERSSIDRLLAAFPEHASPTAAERRAGGSVSETDGFGVGCAERLTNRESQILEFVAERLRDKEIAERLSISAQTVNFHLKNLYHKLGVSNRREAAAKVAGN